MWIRYIVRGFSKILEKYIFIQPIPFIYTLLWKQKGAGTSYQSPFLFPYMFRNILCSEIYHHFSLKVKVVSELFKTVHLLRHTMTRWLAHFSTFALNRRSLRKAEELQKTEFIENGKSFLEEIFHIFKGFLLVKYNKIANITFKNKRYSWHETK